MLAGRARIFVLTGTLAIGSCSTSTGEPTSGDPGAGGGSSGGTRAPGEGTRTGSGSSGAAGSSNGPSASSTGGTGADAADSGESSTAPSGFDGSADGASGAADATTSSSGGSGGFDPCPPIGSCKILPLGDSITYGSTSNNGGYRVELFTRAVHDGKHVTFVGSQSDGPATVAGVSFPMNNEGHPGWTIAQITNIANASSALNDAPAIVLLHIGTNDLPNSLTGASDRLAQLVDQILAALPTSLLVVAQIIPLPWAESSVVMYNAAILGIVQQRASQGKHVIVVDMNTGFPLSNGLGSDNIHPNDTVGYPWMGDKWYAAIQQYLP
jgi:GDSL-like Lipase/Acylhydrolase family